MSTFIGHFATGATVYLSKYSARDTRRRWALPVCILLAVAPDFDYFLLWALHLEILPRITHSLAFCLLLGTIANLLIRIRRNKAEADVHWSLFLIAPLTHVLLDFLVGAHTLPLLWPFSSNEMMSPIGILPSAGHTRSLVSYVFWRNLLIESGILLPILTSVVALKRASPFTCLLHYWRWYAPVWLGLLCWSLSLQR